MACYLLFDMSCFLGGWFASPRLGSSSPVSLLEFSMGSMLPCHKPKQLYFSTNESNTYSQPIEGPSHSISTSLSDSLWPGHVSQVNAFLSKLLWSRVFYYRMEVGQAQHPIPLVEWLGSQKLSPIWQGKSLGICAGWPLWGSNITMGLEDKEPPILCLLYHRGKTGHYLKFLLHIITV